MKRKYSASAGLLGLALMSWGAVWDSSHARADAVLSALASAVTGEPVLSPDGLAIPGGTAPVLLVPDPSPVRTRIQQSVPASLVEPSTVKAHFDVTYIEAGGNDRWGEPCYAFPDSAKAAVDRATLIWGNLIHSSVPIRIRACWVGLADNILGYAGGSPLHRDFNNAPRPATWFVASLANALAGEDLAPGSDDMHIAINGNFSWYYGLDAKPPSNQYDLVSVMLHEIAHGLNFAGSMVSNANTGQSSWGYNTPYPNIYDRLVRDENGVAILDTSLYTNPSQALSTALTSNDLWFHGANAMAANNNARVKLFAPSQWAPGSSYAHLDYNTFFNGPNRLMVYRISAGSAIHDPGRVTSGLLWDLGWTSLPSADVNDDGSLDIRDLLDLIKSNPQSMNGLEAFYLIGRILGR